MNFFHIPFGVEEIFFKSEINSSLISIEWLSTEMFTIEFVGVFVDKSSKSNKALATDLTNGVNDGTNTQAWFKTIFLQILIEININFSVWLFKFIRDFKNWVAKTRKNSGMLNPLDSIFTSWANAKIKFDNNYIYWT